MAGLALAPQDRPDDPAIEDEDTRTTDKLRAQDRRPRRVALVVDDSEDVHVLCREALEDEGFWVQTALNGQDALDLLIAMPTPAVIVLDLLMPKMGGLELLEVIRSYRRLSDVPVLIITASDDETQLGPNLDLLRKPLRCGQLTKRIRQLLGEDDGRP
jgi:CheY-like chemotaxis protein